MLSEGSQKTYQLPETGSRIEPADYLLVSLTMRSQHARKDQTNCHNRLSGDFSNERGTVSPFRSAPITEICRVQDKRPAPSEFSDNSQFKMRTTATPATELYQPNFLLKQSVCTWDVEYPSPERFERRCFLPRNSHDGMLKQWALQVQNPAGSSHRPPAVPLDSFNKKKQVDKHTVPSCVSFLTAVCAQMTTT